MFAYEILERFSNAGVQCESQSSLAESAILKYNWSRIGQDCWPCRLKFNMADVSKHAIALDRNIFRVYKLKSHNIFILMFYNSLEQCCTRVSRNRLIFQFFSPEILESINTTPSLTKVGWCETNWRKITQVGCICEHIWLFWRVWRKREISIKGGGGLND